MPDKVLVGRLPDGSTVAIAGAAGADDPDDMFPWGGLPRDAATNVAWTPPLRLDLFWHNFHGVMPFCRPKLAAFGIVESLLDGNLIDIAGLERTYGNRNRLMIP